MRFGKKYTGGRYHASRKMKKHEKPGIPRVVKLRERKMKVLRVRGGNLKEVLLSENFANVIIKGKCKKTKILNVLETPANKFWARQNVLIKGAIIETELGKAKITNRPSQEGTINAVLLEGK
jgi:small subunit ribosomal protein S8e